MKLADCRVLVVNDDGIDAPGLGVFERALQPHNLDICVMAPASNQSGKSRATSYGSQVRLRQIGQGRYSVFGTPADCTLVGLNGIGRDRPFDLVLSGVNAGANAADDIAASGTIGACLQAASQGVPGIAVSQHWGADKQTDFFCCESMLSELLPQLVAAITTPDMVLNVNFPALDDVANCRGVTLVETGQRVGPISLMSQTDGDDELFSISDLRDDNPDSPTCDLALLIDHWVTVTPLTLNQTNYDAMRTMHSLFAPGAA